MQIQQDVVNHSILIVKKWSVVFCPCFLHVFFKVFPCHIAMPKKY